MTDLPADWETELNTYEKLHPEGIETYYDSPHDKDKEKQEASRSINRSVGRPPTSSSYCNRILVVVLIGLMVLNVLTVSCLIVMNITGFSGSSDDPTTDQLASQDTSYDAASLRLQGIIQNITMQMELLKTMFKENTVYLKKLQDNNTAKLMDTHDKAIHGLQEILVDAIDQATINISDATESIVQTLDAHVKSTDASQQLQLQNTDAAVSLIKNNTQNTISSLASLTNVINKLTIIENSSATTKEIAQNMEVSLEFLDDQHKVLLNAASCQELKDLYPNSHSDFYEVNGEETYCEMGELCETKGPWTRLGYLNMKDSTASCPSPLVYKTSGSIKACANSGDAGCKSVTIQSNNFSYSEVCGRIVGYQYGNPDAFQGPSIGSIDSVYLDGISITHGNPRVHIWSFGVGGGSFHCPCYSPPGASPPSFVGNDYFCESGYPSSASLNVYTNDPLWDGSGCTSNEVSCCSTPGLPWFHKTLSSSTTDNLELRNCMNENSNDEDLYITFYEIYVK